MYEHLDKTRHISIVALEKAGREDLHNVPRSRLQTILERPEVQLVHGLIIDVGRDARNGLVPGVDSGVPVKFLLVTDEVLRDHG